MEDPEAEEARIVDWMAYENQRGQSLSYCTERMFERACGAITSRRILAKGEKGIIARATVVATARVLHQRNSSKMLRQLFELFDEHQTDFTRAKIEPHVEQFRLKATT